LTGALLLVGAQTSGQSAESLLKLALEKQRSLYATVFQTRFDESGGQMLIKVQFAGPEGLKIVMLSPVSRAGIVSVDDTKEFKVFYPDRSLVVVQPSPAAHQPKVDWRMRQIKKNYRLSLGEPAEVAGRAVRPVVIRPRHEELPLRTMYVDTKTHMVLRYKIDRDPARTNLFFDTREVIYGRDAGSIDLKLPSGYEKFEVRRDPGPRPAGTPQAVKSETGFTPRLPKSLPFGFRIHGLHLIGSEKRTFLAVRLSDGMCSLTVFQWLGSRFTRDPGGRPLAALSDEHGVRFSLTSTPGDRIPRSVAFAILEAFGGKDL
jgi:hypothetical protein